MTPLVKYGPTATGTIARCVMCRLFIRLNPIVFLKIDITRGFIAEIGRLGTSQRRNANVCTTIVYKLYIHGRDRYSDMMIYKQEKYTGANTKEHTAILPISLISES